VREPVERFEVPDAEAVEVATALDETAFDELDEDLPPGALDVHPAASREVSEFLAHPCRAREVRAVDPDRALVLDDGRVVDTILHALVTPLSHVPALVAVLLMVPFHALLHVPVPSVSGHAVLTMPLFAPIADLLGFSREAAVISYQTGAGLTEMITPTNGALMAVLLAAGVPLQRWLRFAAAGIAVLVLVGVVAAAFAM
jgi:hypothetical protein